jgi:hypothetical protein
MSEAFSRDDYYYARKGEPPTGTDVIYGLRRSTLAGQIAENGVTDQPQTKAEIAARAAAAGVRRPNGEEPRSQDVSFLERGTLEGHFVQVRQDGAFVQVGDEPPYYWRRRRPDEPIQESILRPESGLQRSRQNAERRRRLQGR